MVVEPPRPVLRSFGAAVIRLAAINEDLVGDVYRRGRPIVYFRLDGLRHRPTAPTHQRASPRNNKTSPDWVELGVDIHVHTLGVLGYR